MAPTGGGRGLALEGGVALCGRIAPKDGGERVLPIVKGGGVGLREEWLESGRFPFSKEEAGL